MMYLQRAGLALEQQALSNHDRYFQAIPGLKAYMLMYDDATPMVNPSGQIALRLLTDHGLAKALRHGNSLLAREDF